MPKNIDPKKEQKARAGHQEIQGETIAKFEFFDNGYNPYSRYLDIDKVDLILRKRNGTHIKYIEVQVKYGRLYDCSEKWAKKNFDYTSWKNIGLDAFLDCPNNNLYVVYVLAHPDIGYKGDIFIFPVKEFNHLIKSAIRINSKRGAQAKMNIAHCKHNGRWYLWKKRNFTDISDSNNVIDVTEYRRKFDI